MDTGIRQYDEQEGYIGKIGFNCNDSDLMGIIKNTPVYDSSILTMIAT